MSKDLEKKPVNRKDMVKNIAIAFLTVMLILTFFSNTIMNYTLPQVATVQITDGTISPQIRGSGTVTAEDPYNITVKETRKISGVAVKEGAHVEIGDVIYYLEDKESEELTKAKETLDTMELEYEQMLFSGDVPSSVITNVRNGKTASYDTYQAQVGGVLDTYNAALAEDNAAQAEIDYLTQLRAYEQAGMNYNTATPEYLLAQAQVDIEKAKNDGDEDRVVELNNFVAELTRDKSQLSTYSSQSGFSYDQKLATASEKKAKTAAALKEAERVKTEQLKSINVEISLCAKRDSIAEQKEKIAKLESESVGSSVKAPVAGTVSSISKVAGESTSADETIAVIQVDGKDMTTSFSVTNAQAAKLKVGDAAQPQNAWQFNSDFKATLTQIKNDKTDPAGKKLLTFKIESTEVTPGQTLSLAIGERTQNYDMIVPNSAIKTDSNGKFVLIVKSKSSPLGNRYTATRADVNVVASDDKNSAITAAIDNYEYVITTSNKPVKAGEQVRLANE
ncbi:MAG: HlyD family efflux transporter periplasmic adaptor subunit [Butyrivibrio sp.]|jgi:multidrug efflux pump subunit AcrA (membrane-fusion protein)|uniref:HlyD family efflux transporter periplasmic adaptor subunit n=1 Tax=Butyrivibrio sp. TaxID=28121 RepID=UPI001EC3BA5B|nr:HlyD family efflux transporter periplasmic adaptor subunit [Butyrivibrio sp.]MBE5841863.1 HlyD family efflux transporter periplasmic adaptor subunit [Butyrivibrio sp.]